MLAGGLGGISVLRFFFLKKKVNTFVESHCANSGVTLERERNGLTLTSLETSSLVILQNSFLCAFIELRQATKKRIQQVFSAFLRPR